ncbi:MAG: magnesium transporter [Deferribacteraceae bacterium]|jgi:magnesium transporter|nr:magnesium transporter [Deferribacteraceae bacterium]
MNTSLRVTLENVKKLVRRNAKGPLYKLLNKLHPADIAQIIANLTDIDKKGLFTYLDNTSRLAEIILELDEKEIIDFFEDADPKRAGEVIMAMESDDKSFILRLLPESTKENLSQYVTLNELTEIEELLHYPEKTAGAMMNTDYVAFSEETTIKEATKTIHQSADVEMIYYIYVVDSEERLTGVLSLRQLILNPPERQLKEVMTTNVISVMDSVHQEDAAKLVAKYDFMALPVVNDQRQLQGIITFDDIIDVIREEATEDVYRITGTPQAELAYDENVIKSARVRLPWLLITLVGELFSGILISFFQGKLVEFLVLSAFMPVIMAMGGNVGTQSSTITIRNIAIGRIDAKHNFPVLWKELRVGLLMGIVSAIPVIFLAPLFHTSNGIGIVVGIALFCAMSFAAFSGTFVPLLLMRLKIDPAVASGPFISTFNDITGLTIYFSVALSLMAFL